MITVWFRVLVVEVRREWLDKIYFECIVNRYMDSLDIGYERKRQKGFRDVFEDLFSLSFILWFSLKLCFLGSFF